MDTDNVHSMNAETVGLGIPHLKDALHVGAIVIFRCGGSATVSEIRTPEYVNPFGTRKVEHDRLFVVFDSYQYGCTYEALGTGNSHEEGHSP